VYYVVRKIIHSLLIIITLGVPQVQRIGLTILILNLEKYIHLRHRIVNQKFYGIIINYIFGVNLTYNIK